MQADWPSENVILGLLCERPRHGYELARLVREDEALRAIWRIERSEIYFLLKKLKSGGLIMDIAQERPNGPARTILAPTDSGRRAFEEWLNTPEPRPRNLRTALLARVWMGLRYNPANAVTLIDAQKRLLSEWLTNARRHESENEVVALVQRLREAQVSATLEALDGFRRLAVARSAARGDS